MTKPDDIPQDVWETTNGLSQIIADDSGWLPSFEVFEAIARSIMAEREACSALAEDFARRVMPKDHRSYVFDLAFAIRERGSSSA